MAAISTLRDYGEKAEGQPIFPRVFPSNKQKQNWKIDTSLVAIGAQNLFFLTLQTGSKFPVDKRNIKDVYFFLFQKQEKSAILQILHF